MDAERDGEEEGEGGGEVVHVDDGEELSVLVDVGGDGGPGDLLHPWLHHGYKISHYIALLSGQVTVTH